MKSMIVYRLSLVRERMGLLRLTDDTTQRYQIGHVSSRDNPRARLWNRPSWFEPLRRSTPEAVTLRDARIPRAPKVERPTATAFPGGRVHGRRRDSVLE